MWFASWYLGQILIILIIGHINDERRILSNIIRKSIKLYTRISLLVSPELHDLHGGNHEVFSILIVLIFRRKDEEKEDRE